MSKKSKCTTCGGSQEDAFAAIPESLSETSGDSVDRSERPCKTKCSCKKKVYTYPITACTKTSSCKCSSCCPGTSSCENLWEDDAQEGSLLEAEEAGTDSAVNYPCVPKPPKPVCASPKEAFARIDNLFSFPDVGAVAQAKITNVILTEGQPIGNPSYGSLIVHLVDQDSSLYNLENAEYLNNSLDVIGKPVVCGEEFYLGLAEVNSSGVEPGLACNHLLEDFVVPALNGTVTVNVESTKKFIAGEVVLFRKVFDPTVTYSYIISDVTGIDTAVLENNGNGGTVGATIYADQTSDGVWDWCVEPLVDQSVCAQANDSLCMNHILGCDIDGNPIKLVGTIENEVPAWDPNCGGYVNKVVPKVTKCVLLDTCFQVSPSDACDRAVVYVTTTDDQGLLDAALDALLSDNAEPLITICDYTFSLDLVNSIVGSLRITPIFDAYEVVNFDQTCKVCIPEDCCFQCNPQVIYPVADYFPPGLNDATTLAIPTNLLQAASGEYKLSVAKSADGLTNILFYHDPNSNAVLNAYDGATGDEIALETLEGDPNDYYYHKFTYCNQESSCPVEGQFEEDILARFFTLSDGLEIILNYHTTFDVFECDQVGVEGQQLSQTQMSILANFKGPNNLSTIAFGTDEWGTPAPEPDGVKPWGAFSGYNKRTFTLFYPTCVVVTTRPTIFIRVPDQPDYTWTKTGEYWVYNAADEVTVDAHATERFSIGQVVKFTQNAVELEYTITNVTSTTIELSGNVVDNSAITGVYLRDPLEEPPLPPADDFIYFNMETTSMFKTQRI